MTQNGNGVRNELADLIKYIINIEDANEGFQYNINLCSEVKIIRNVRATPKELTLDFIIRLDRKRDIYKSYKISYLMKMHQRRGAEIDKKISDEVDRLMKILPDIEKPNKNENLIRTFGYGSNKDAGYGGDFGDK